MIVSITPFLRNVLLADAAMSAAAGLAAAAGAGLLSPLLGLPQGLLFWAGILLLPWAVILFAVSRRAETPRLWLVDIVAVNALWVAASFGLLVSGLVAPTALGIAFVVAQALAVALLADLQFVGMRRAPRLAA